MTKEEVNAWAILIVVIKNKGTKYEHVDNLIGDIEEIRELIENLGWYIFFIFILNKLFVKIVYIVLSYERINKD